MVRCYLTSHPLLPLLLLPSVFTSIRVFSSKLAFCIRWPKHWNCSFSVCPSDECSGLISFRIGCFDLLAVQGTLKSLLQHHHLKASILWHSVFFMVQLSHLCMTPGKTMALTLHDQKCWCFENSFLISWGGSFQSPECQKYAPCLGKRGMAPCDGLLWATCAGQLFLWVTWNYKCTL